MKLNQLGTLIVIGVVGSLTAACNGSPTKPAAFVPASSDGTSAASVNVSAPLSVGAADQVCTTQPPADQGGDQSGDTPNGDAAIVTCEPLPSTESSGDVAVIDAPAMDDAQFAYHLYR